MSQASSSSYRDEKEEILKGLEPLFKQAEQEGKWFYISYQQLWFSPQELRKEQAAGSFVWAACNWKLRDPYVALQGLDQKIADARKDKLEFENRMKLAGFNFFCDRPI